MLNIYVTLLKAHDSLKHLELKNEALILLVLIFVLLYHLELHTFLPFNIKFIRSV